MRLFHRHRHRPGSRGVASRVAISQAEITADLHYPAGRLAPRNGAGTGVRRSGAR